MPPLFLVRLTTLVSVPNHPIYGTRDSRFSCRNMKATGLGLSIFKHLAELNGETLGVSPV